MTLLVASQESTTPIESDRIDVLWRRVNARWSTHRISHKATSRRWQMGLAGGFVAAAAAVLAVVSAPTMISSPGPREKGALEVASGRLWLGRSPAGAILEDETVELRYSLDRDAYVTVVHGRPSAPLEILYRGWVAASEDGHGVFRVSGGTLGFRFDGDAGKHLFALITSDRRHDDGELLRAVDARWFDSPSFDRERPHLAARVSGVTVDVASRR